MYQPIKCIVTKSPKIVNIAECGILKEKYSKYKGSTWCMDAMSVSLI